MTEIRVHRARPLSTLLSELLSMPIPEEIRVALSGKRMDGRRKKGRPKKGALNLPPGTTFGQGIVTALACRALSGDVFAAKTVFNAVEGTPARAILSASLGNSDSDPVILERLMQLFSGMSHGAAKPAELVEHGQREDNL